MTLPDQLAGDTIDIDDGRLRRLRAFNVVMGGLHAVSGAAMLALSNDFSLPVTTLNQNGPPGTPVDEWMLESIVDVAIGPATSLFLFLSAAFHLIVATIGYERYCDELRHGRNRFRWAEYSLSASLMIVLIAMVTGVTSVAALVAIGFVNASMILFGWVMEVVNPPGRPVWWTPFWFGCIAGIAPWLAVYGTVVINVNQPGAQGPPGFVYGILVTIFVFFNCFAVNQWLQYRGIGKWRDYAFGEVVYIVLSLTAKSTLAWQIFANTLID